MMSRPRSLGAILAALWLAGSASADHDISGLGTPVLAGTSFYLAGSNSGSLDYAVFAPGQYLGADPSAGTEYVYSYQAFNSSVSSFMSQFSVYVDDVAAHNAMFNAATTGNAPILTVLNPIGPKSLFDVFAPPIAPGSNSKVVLFTSPHGPTFGATAAIFTADPSAQGSPLVPTPVPTPASAVLALLALPLLWRRV